MDKPEVSIKWCLISIYCVCACNKSWTVHSVRFIAIVRIMMNGRFSTLPTEALIKSSFAHKWLHMKAEVVL